jgi:acyl-CoA synthetase (AMP-forming)/AMP-acid ligase II
MLDTLARLEQTPDAVVGLRDGVPVTAAAFIARMQEWRFVAAKTPGTAVALYIEDSLEFGAALYGCWQAGKTVWIGADTLDATCRSLDTSVDAFFGAFPSQYKPQWALPGEASTEALDLLAPDTVALVVHTSGSTGAPQAIPKKLCQMASEVDALERQFGLRLGSADIVATVSHQHIYGLLFKVLWPLARGRAVHAASLNYPEQLAALPVRGPLALVASPAHLKRMPSHLDWSAAAGALCAVFSSGGPLTAEASLAAGALLGQSPFEVYGSSETGGIAWRQQQAGGAGAWQALPGVFWRINADGGLLEVRSPHLSDANWMTLSDRAQAWDGKRFLLHGRSDRIVKIEEKRVSLDALEMALQASDLVEQAKVIVSDEAGGQRVLVAAFIVPSTAGQDLLAREGKAAMSQRLRLALADSVEAVALPRRWRYLDAMPVNAQGKTTHAQLTALLGTSLDSRPRLPDLRLLEQHPDRVLLELTAPASLLYFDGHFGQAPILAGVVQVDWAILYGRRYFAVPPVFKAIHALKFQNVIQPDTPVSLELNFDAAKGSLVFRYFSDAGQHAGGRILFGLQ